MKIPRLVAEAFFIALELILLLGCSYKIWISQFFYS